MVQQGLYKRQLVPPREAECTREAGRAAATVLEPNGGEFMKLQEVNSMRMSSSCLLSN